MGKSKADLRIYNRNARAFFLALSSVNGAEEDGDEGADESQESEPSEKDGEGSKGTSTATGEKTYTKAEYDAIVAESKGYRKRAQTAESKLSEADKAKMGELERAQAEAKEAKERAAQLEKQINQLRIEGAVKDEATAQKFTDPADAISFLDVSAIELNDDGEPNKNSLKAAIKKLATEKPYLIQGGSSAGSGDGGARGGHQSDKTTEYDKEYQGRNMVPIG